MSSAADQALDRNGFASSDPATLAVEAAVAAIGRGGMAVVVDDADRENEGDLVMAGEAATDAALGFMIRHTSGVICAAMAGDRLDALRVPLMVADSTDSQGTAFTVSVDLRAGTTTGISARDRAATIRALADPRTRAAELTRPGHVFPLRYREGGVLKRAGHTEAAVDLVRLAGRGDVGVLCEIVNDDGSMARGDDVARFARTHDLPRLQIADLLRYRRMRETLVRRAATTRLPTRFGDFVVHAYESTLDGHEHLALVMGSVAVGEPVMVRVHSECLTGDVLRSQRCDCGTQLRLALERIGAAKRGVLVYLRGHEGRAADSREYGIGAQILTHLGVSRMRLMTNNPAKYHGLAGFGLEIVERIPLVAASTIHSAAYLSAKAQRLGHIFETDTTEVPAT